MAADVLARCDQNYWATMAGLATAVSGDDAVWEDGLLLTSCRSPIGFFNSAFVLPGSRRSMVDRVVRAIEFYAHQGVPFVLRTRREVGPDLPDAARRLGLEETNQLPLMVLAEIPPVPRLPEGLRVQKVTDDDGLADHRAVVASSFGVPDEAARQLFTHATIDMPGTEMFVGYLDAEPVATSLVSVTGEVAGVYNVATVEAWRGRGLGAALTWSAIGAGARRGASSASLQASDLGRPVYERMGFELVDRYLQFTGG